MSDGLHQPDLHVLLARYGSYREIPWERWDAFYEAWQKARRDYLGGAYSRAEVLAARREERRLRRKGKLS